MAWVLGMIPRVASEAIPSTDLPYNGAGPWVDPCVTLATVPEHMIRLIGLMRRQAPWIRTVSPIRACERRRDGTLSMHATGRAADVMVPVPSGPEGKALADWLVENAAPLGVQLVIWDRSVWQGSLPVRSRFSAYTGANPHTDHVHVELTTHPGPRLDPAMQEPIAPQFMAFVRNVMVPSMPTPAPSAASTAIEVAAGNQAATPVTKALVLAGVGAAGALLVTRGRATPVQLLEGALVGGLLALFTQPSSPVAPTTSTAGIEMPRRSRRRMRY